MTQAPRQSTKQMPRRLLTQSLIICSFALFICFGSPTPASAQGSALDKRTPVVYLGMDGTFATHKSNTLVTTDFASGFDLEAGTWTGKSRTIGMAVRQSNTHTTFSQGNANAASTWTDFSLRYRFYWFYPSVSLGSCNLVAKQDGAEVIDLLCTTLGASLGVRVPVGPYVVVNFSPQMTQPVAVKDRLARDTSTGMRSEFDLGAALRPKLSWLDINVGFRYRSYDLEISGKATREIYAGPYLGLTFGLTY